MKLCACRKDCKKEVKGPGRYALGHNPNSDQGRMPQILRKLREKSINTKRAEEEITKEA